MEASKKKPIMIAVIVVCLVVAFMVTVKRKGGGEGVKFFEGKPMWIKCKDCGATWQMDTAVYYRWIEENIQGGSVAPPMECEQCGATAAYRAEECPKCGEVFIYDVQSGDFPDRCPKCKYSTMEERRKSAKAAKGE